jgi:putative spermidine/putrescine transport system ATP-binding protein
LADPLKYQRFGVRESANNCSTLPAQLRPREDSAISLATIIKTYGGVRVLGGVSLDIPNGSYTALLGASGSGKTTLLRIIAGFIAPDGGTVLISGVDVTRQPARMRDVGMVFQNYALFPHLTARENIGYPLKARGFESTRRTKLVEEYLELMKLSAVAHHYPEQLSGGQQQRVALGRSLVYGPRLLLLDEPLGALDKRLRSEMQQFLKSLQRDLAVTFVHVTHDQDEALALATHVALLRDGTVEQFGTPEELYETPASAFVADFIGESNLLSCRIVGRGHSGFTVALDDGSTVDLPESSVSQNVESPKGEVVLSLRPENGCVNAQADVSMAVDIPGTVKDSTFMGTHHEALLATDVGDLMIRTEGRLSRGERLHLQWTGAKCRLLPAQ